MENNNSLLRVNNLKTYFYLDEGVLKAVDGVSFKIGKEKVLGLVGESGCGKTTIGRCILRAIEPTEGEIFFKTEDNEIVDTTLLEKKELRRMRKDMQMIFQAPYSSLDTRMTVLDIIGEPLLVNKIARGRKLEEKVKDLVKVVGLNIKHLKRYPHAFSLTFTHIFPSIVEQPFTTSLLSVDNIFILSFLLSLNNTALSN